ncbi:hypothetical protein PJO48_29765, partial [Mycobacterium kansasii]
VANEAEAVAMGEIVHIVEGVEPSTAEDTDSLATLDGAERGKASSLQTSRQVHSISLENMRVILPRKSKQKC